MVTDPSPAVDGPPASPSGARPANADGRASPLAASWHSSSAPDSVAGDPGDDLPSIDAVGGAGAMGPAAGPAGYQNGHGGYPQGYGPYCGGGGYGNDGHRFCNGAGHESLGAGIDNALMGMDSWGVPDVAQRGGAPGGRPCSPQQPDADMRDVVDDAKGPYGGNGGFLGRQAQLFGPGKVTVVASEGADVRADDCGALPSV